MTKQEFIAILRQSLAGEVSSDIIEQNVRYYDQYITSQSEEEKVINDLGDPRLIAKTIIESDKAARQKGRYTGNQGSYSDYSEQEDEKVNYQENRNQGSNLFFTNIKWYHKLAFALIILLIFIVIVLIGSIIIKFLFVFLVPILIIMMLVALFRKR